MEDKATEDTILPFSYNVATAMLRCQHNLSWNIYEKGSESSNPKQRCEISFSIIRSALSQIKDHIRETECVKVSLDLEDESFEFFVKEENSQFMSSVKTRGVIYTLLQLSDEQKRRGVIAISTGSFAVILCYYGRKFNIPVTVVMPTSVADKYVDRCKNLSISASDEEVEHAECVSSNVAVTVLIQGSDMIEAHNNALRIAKEKGLFYLDGNDHPNMIIGQATLGIEIMEQLSTIDTIILPTRTDGCGLTAAIAMIIKHYDSSIHVIEAQIESLDPLIENIRSRTHLYHELESSAKDWSWYAVNRGNRGIPHCWIDSIVRLDETLVNDATNFLLKEKKNIGFKQFVALGLAVIRNSQISQTYDYKRKRIVICPFGKIDSSKELTTTESHEALHWLFA